MRRVKINCQPLSNSYLLDNYCSRLRGASMSLFTESVWYYGGGNRAFSVTNSQNYKFSRRIPPI